MMNRLLAPWRALRQRYWASLLFDVFLILTVFWCIHAWQTRGLPGAGELPRLSAAELDGDRTQQALPVAGKGVVYFFAPWCFYCKHSIGNIDELVRSGKVEWARAVALDFADLQEVRDFVSEVGLEQPCSSATPGPPGTGISGFFPPISSLMRTGASAADRWVIQPAWD